MLVTGGGVGGVSGESSRGGGQWDACHGEGGGSVVKVQEVGDSGMDACHWGWRGGQW